MTASQRQMLERHLRILEEIQAPESIIELLRKYLATQHGYDESACLQECYDEGGFIDQTILVEAAKRVPAIRSSK